MIDLINYRDEDFYLQENTRKKNFEDIKTIIQDYYAGLLTPIDRTKKIISIASDIYLNSDNNKVEDIKVSYSNGLHYSNGKIYAVPTTIIESAKKDNSILSKINPNFEGGLYSLNELFSGNRFGAYSSKNTFEISTFVDSVDTISFNTLNHLYSKYIDITAIYVNGSRVSFNRMETLDKYFYSIDRVENSRISIVFSTFKDDNGNAFLIEGLKIGTDGLLNDSREIVIGPISNNSEYLTKVGVSFSSTNNLELYYSYNLLDWSKMNSTNSKSYFVDLNTVYSRIKEKTKEVYLRIISRPTIYEVTKSKKRMIAGAGEDCYSIGATLGSTNYSSSYIEGITEYIYSKKYEEYTLPDKMKEERYLIKSSPLKITNSTSHVQDRYSCEIVQNPEKNKILSIIGLSSVGDLQAFKLKESYIPGIYTYIIDGVSDKSFEIYGEYIFSPSMYIISVDSSKNVKLRIKNDNEELIVEDLQRAAYKGEHLYNFVSIILNSNTNIFYPYLGEKPSSEFLSYKDCGYVEDIRNIQSAVKVKRKELLSRGKSKQLKAVSPFNILTSSEAIRVPYINGTEEFYLTSIDVIDKDIPEGETSIPFLYEFNSIKIFSGDFEEELFQAEDVSHISRNTFYIKDGLLHTGYNGRVKIELYSREKDDRLLFSVNDLTGIIYFSSIQNNTEIIYDFYDLVLLGDLFLSKDISIDSSSQEYLIEEEEIVERIIEDLQEVSISIGVL